MNALVADGDGVRLRILVQPRASRTEVSGPHGDALRIRLTAPPVDGAANEALCRFLSQLLGVPGGAVAVTAGYNARRKTVRVSGVDPATVARTLGLTAP